ncbi:hypothetical protein [Tunturiibacter gelidiferens]|uniref:hypothetical protein n=1 Tax=Tunturiibacter gelidiferens TaxID=3069689 RepID=UPI003D9BF265
MQWASEIYDVSDHTPGVLPNAMLANGHFIGSYQPMFHVGDNLALPTNYAAMGDSLNLQQAIGQPSSIGALVISNLGYSAFGNASITVQNFPSTVDNFGSIGTGETKSPPT